ncbi:hypothetical protein K1719_006659 [Acacia pycnantha]|nr:hypothetical protein K1719_006659 [Acacia pycnantha]
MEEDGSICQRRTHRLRLNAEGKKKLPSCKPNLSGIVLLVDKDDNHCCATNRSAERKEACCFKFIKFPPLPLCFAVSTSYSEPGKFKFSRLSGKEGGHTLTAT